MKGFWYAKKKSRWDRQYFDIKIHGNFSTYVLTIEYVYMYF